MRIIARKTLRDFWKKHADSEGPLKEWEKEVKKCKWSSPADVKVTYRSASILKNSRVVFNIKENAYRLIVGINYGYGIVYIRFIGTHRQYDKIKAEEV